MVQAFALKPKEYRIGILMGALLYWLFGIVDPFMLPDTYKQVWYLRFILVTPSIILSYLFSYSRHYKKYARLMIFLVTLSAQVGIVYMVYLAKPSEQGYFAYYAGLVTTLFWAMFIFRFRMIDTTVLFLVSLVLYNSVIVFSQNLLSFGYHSKEFAWFIENNFILIASGTIAIFGSYMMGKYRQRILEESEKYMLAKEKAEESDRLKSAFLANMSHEIRTPLNSILGFSEILSDDDLNSPTRKRYTEMIQTSGNQLLRIIGDVLDISKIESNQLKIDHLQINMHNLLTNCLASAEQYRKAHKKNNIRLELIIPKKYQSLQLKSDPYRLTQIFDNLITNAIKNTDIGVIEFGINEIHKIDGIAKIEFYVKDTGIGIRKKDFDLLFLRFSRIDNHRIQRGNGIGLCITKALIEMLGGKIWFQSEENKGTTFYFNIKLDKINSQIQDEQEFTASLELTSI